MLRSVLSIALISVFLGCSQSSQAQAPVVALEQLAVVEAKLSKWYPEDQPGAVVLLMKDGQVVFRKGYGLANATLKAPIKPEMTFRIGSVTKQFTAAAVLKLVEDGKVDVNLPISRYLKDLPETWKAITVEQLLTHTAGLPNYTDVEALWEKPDKRFKPAKMLEEYVGDLPLQFEPGSKYAYSNTGYVLLGMLIERISGQSYDDFLQKRLLDPLGLDHTHYDSDTDPDPDLPVGYRQGTSVARSWSVTQKYAAGGLVSTASDLALWTQALHDGKVVKPESLAKMMTPVKLKGGREESYGYGLEFRSSHGHRLVGHGGEVDGFQCRVEADPAARAVAVILSNSREPKAEIEYFTRYLLALAAGRALPEPVPAPIEPSALQSVAGLYSLENQIRLITFEGGKLHSRRLGHSKFALIPLSPMEFRFEDSDAYLRFEREGGKVTGMYRRYADFPESRVYKWMEALPDPDPEMTRLVQRSLDELANGNLDLAVFTPKLARQITSGMLKEMATDLQALGKLTSIDLYRREERKDGLCMCFYRVGFGERNLGLFLWMTKDKKIADFDSLVE